MIDRSGEVIIGETLHLASQRGVDVWNDVIYDCRLVDCRVRIDYPRGLTLFCSTLVNTTVEVSRTAAECGWRGCFFDSCTFKGKYYSCMFGGENDYCPNKAGLRNCDFTAATLNFCTFFNCTPDDLRLPGWPHVTIFSPRQNADDFTDLTSDPILAGIHGIMRVTSPKEVAITYDMTDYVKKWRADVLQGREFQKLLARIRSEPEPPEPVISLERIRELLKKKPYVFM